MRIAVVGSGIAGLASAWLLSQKHEVTLFEANDYLGGHTHTHCITEPNGNEVQVDSGFIVHNPENYPYFTRMLDALGVATTETSMSFAVHDERRHLIYNPGSLNQLFCQRRNLFSPRFIGMLNDIKRFYAMAPKVLADENNTETLSEFLSRHRFGELFVEAHLVPMASALWSSPHQQIMHFPIRYLLQFMDNHHMLQVKNRPAWRVLEGGSHQYVKKMTAAWQTRVYLNSPVRRIERHDDGHITLATDQAKGAFDHVVLACHSDQALALLANPSKAEQRVLGAIAYQKNDTVLHHDERVLPPIKKAWAAWNAYSPASGTNDCTVSYCMNILQHIQSERTYIVSLNRTHDIAPEKILAQMTYHHPIYTPKTIQAQQQKDDIQGKQNTWFAGAYWGWGFHEDGMRSAVQVANALGVSWPS